MSGIEVNALLIHLIKIVFRLNFLFQAVLGLSFRPTAKPKFLCVFEAISGLFRTFKAILAFSDHFYS